MKITMNVGNNIERDNVDADGGHDNDDNNHDDDDDDVKAVMYQDQRCLLL